MAKIMRIVCVLVCILNLSACGRRQENLDAAIATRMAATQRANQQQAPDPAQPQPQPQPQPGPAGSYSADLTITSIEPNSDAPTANQGFEVAVTIKNLGPETAPAFRWALIPDYQSGGANTPSLEMNGPALGPDEEITIRADARYAAAGRYMMRAQVFAAGNANDPHPENDAREIRMRVDEAQSGGNPAGSPFMDLTTYNISPAEPRTGEAVTFMMVVQNHGSAAALGPRWVIYPAYQPNSASQPMMSGTIQRLEPGAEERVERTFTYNQAGTYTVRLNPNDQPVGGPVNNWLEITITVRPAQDSQGGAAPAALYSPTQCTWTVKTDTSVTVNWKWEGAAGSILGFRIYERQLGLQKQVGPEIRGAKVANLPAPLPPTIFFYIVAYNTNGESSQSNCRKIP